MGYCREVRAKFFAPGASDHNRWWMSTVTVYGFYSGYKLVVLIIDLTLPVSHNSCASKVTWLFVMQIKCFIVCLFLWKVWTARLCGVSRTSWPSQLSHIVSTNSVRLGWDYLFLWEKTDNDIIWKNPQRPFVRKKGHYFCSFMIWRCQWCRNCTLE